MRSVHFRGHFSGVLRERELARGGVAEGKPLFSAQDVFNKGKKEKIIPWRTSRLSQRFAALQPLFRDLLRQLDRRCRGRPAGWCLHLSEKRSVHSLTDENQGLVMFYTSCSSLTIRRSTCYQNMFIVPTIEFQAEPNSWRPWIVDRRLCLNLFGGHLLSWYAYALDGCSGRY